PLTIHMQTNGLANPQSIASHISASLPEPPTPTPEPSFTCTARSNVGNTHPLTLGFSHNISVFHESSLERCLMRIASSMEKNPSHCVLAIPLQSSNNKHPSHARSGGHRSSTSK